MNTQLSVGVCSHIELSRAEESEDRLKRAWVQHCTIRLFASNPKIKKHINHALTILLYLILEFV